MNSLEYAQSLDSQDNIAKAKINTINERIFHLSKNINSKPKIFLMHGANDPIVPPMHLLESKEYLLNHKIKIKTKLFNNCEHRIPVEGSSLGLEFLKKNLL